MRRRQPRPHQKAQSWSRRPPTPRLRWKSQSTVRRPRFGSVSASTVTSANGFRFRLGARSYRVRNGEFGAVRSVGGGEVLVGRTELSYTYAQTPKEGTPYNLYHATVEARPL